MWKREESGTPGLQLLAPRGSLVSGLAGRRLCPGPGKLLGSPRLGKHPRQRRSEDSGNCLGQSWAVERAERRSRAKKGSRRLWDLCLFSRLRGPPGEPGLVRKLCQEFGPGGARVVSALAVPAIRAAGRRRLDISGSGRLAGIQPWSCRAAPGWPPDSPLLRPLWPSTPAPSACSGQKYPRMGAVISEAPRMSFPGRIALDLKTKMI